MSSNCKIIGTVAHHEMVCDTEVKPAPKDEEAKSTDSYFCVYKNNDVYDKTCVKISGPIKSLEQFYAELTQIGAEPEKIEVAPKIEAEPKIDVEQKEEKVPVKWGPFF